MSSAHLKRAFAAAFFVIYSLLKKRPDNSQEHRRDRQHEEGAAESGEQPASDMLRAEWAAFQALIREIHRSEEEHQAAERELGNAQLRTAKGLNWVTAIGAAVGLLGLLGVIASLAITKKTAEDGAIVARAAESQARILADQEVRQLRAYVFPDVSIENVNGDISKIETIPPQIDVVIKNSGLTPAYNTSVLGGAVLTVFPTII